MASPLETLGMRAGYGVRQAPRVAWYLAHSYALGHVRRLAEQIAPSGDPPPRPTGRTPDRDRLWRDLAQLFLRDLANVEAGIYPMPRDEDGDLGELLGRSRAFFLDVPRVFLRRREKAHQEVFSEEFKGRFPRYYLQNFHYQSGGYLSEESARLYDIQVEVLFNGAANAMRRQALVPIHAALRGRDQRRIRLVDVACGTGRFLRFAKDAYPGLNVLGIDLSPPYLAEARRHLKGRGRTRLALAKAEALPLADASQDIVTTIFLYHELPPKVRREVAAEFARVLKPGGLLVFIDSLQRGDVADYDGLLEVFPVGYHEPYFDGYTREDLDALFGEAGFAPVHRSLAFVSKVVAYRRQ